MKKLIIALCTILIVVSLTGCKTEHEKALDELKKESNELKETQKHIDELEKQKSNVEAMIEYNN